MCLFQQFGILIIFVVIITPSESFPIEKPSEFCANFTTALKDCINTTGAIFDVNETIKYCKNLIYMASTLFIPNFCTEYNFKVLYDTFGDNIDLFSADCINFTQSLIDADSNISENYKTYTEMMSCYDCDGNYNSYSQIWGCDDCKVITVYLLKKYYYQWGCATYKWGMTDLQFSCLKTCQYVMKSCPILTLSNALEDTYLFMCRQSKHLLIGRQNLQERRS
ncbi:hypothetical protein RF11_06222 [Thelohanellus kitauei]|uniref:Uncharacterized protein n=1 Tax=Thelohanellus kitauei TaxID=669202 RepID=A0A0C2MPY0_THEKT|nr:hypothetical protein RF11_06222 [Thelohanellus kitauei]